MAIDYYPNKGVEELLGLLESLQSRQIKGGITEVNAAGVRTARDFRNSMGARVEVEMRRVMYSLWLRDPVTYQNPYAQRITRTRTRYTFS